MGKAENSRKMLERARRRMAGLVPKEVWVHPDDWAEIKRLIEKLAKRRERK